MKRRSKMTAIVVATGLFALGFSPPARTQWTKLSGTAPAFADVQPPPPLPGSGTTVRQEPPFRFSPDGSRVVFVQDRTTDDVWELWSISLPGGSPVRLNGLLPSGTAVYRYRISPDSARVVYLAPQDSASQPELYSVPIDGPFSAAVQLNPALPAGVSAGDFEITPDGSRVVFTTYSDALAPASWPKLYSVPLTGGAPVVLAQGPAAPVTVRGVLTILSDKIDFQLTPDGAQVVFIHDSDAGGAAVAELYRVPIDGGTAVRVNDPIPAYAAVRRFGLSPAGNRAWYLADALSDGVFELFSVPLVGGGAVKINGAVVAGGGVVDARFSPDGSRIVYVADQLVDTRYEVFSSPVNVSAAVPISGTLPAGTVVLPFSDFWGFTTSGTRVVYYEVELVGDKAEVFSAPIAGGAEPRRLHPPLATDGAAALFRRSPVDDRIAVSAKTTALAPTLLYVTDAAGGPIWRIDPDIQSSGAVYDFRFDPAGSMLVAGLRILDTDSTDLYFLPAVWDPSSPAVRPSFAGGQAGGGLTFSPDVTPLLFIGDIESDDEIELFSTEAVLFASGFEAGHTWSWSSRTDVPLAAHSVCTIGSALSAAADPCIAAVCSNDSFCCDGGWDVLCVAKVPWACDASCP